ncbi:hypothetical protein Tco_0390630 [Tanacetum coccineum]
MASSSNSFVSTEFCKCELPLRVLTSWIPGNPARRFFVCPNQSRPINKKRGAWMWFDEEIECDWYMMHLYAMYILLNPQQRCLINNEISRQERIQDLEADLNEINDELQKTLKSKPVKKVTGEAMNSKAGKLGFDIAGVKFWGMAKEVLHFIWFHYIESPCGGLNFKNLAE